jgi:hypothetical protein
LDEPNVVAKEWVRAGHLVDVVRHSVVVDVAAVEDVVAPVEWCRAVEAVECPIMHDQRRWKLNGIGMEKEILRRNKMINPF